MTKTEGCVETMNSNVPTVEQLKFVEGGTEFLDHVEQTNQAAVNRPLVPDGDNVDRQRTASAVGSERSSRILSMPLKTTVKKARQAKRKGKAPATQAGEFVHEEIREIRRGKHGARSAQQAIAIGLSKARRAGVELPPPAKGRTSEATRTKAKRDLEKAKTGLVKPSAKRSKARVRALKREPRSSVSHKALAKQAGNAARRRRRTTRRSGSTARKGSA
jgi:hypothetical protein